MTLVFDEKRHTYSLDGERLPSVTQILGAIRKPFLETWRGRLGNAECDRISKESADFGTRVHAACEKLANANHLDYLDSFEDDMLPYAEQFNGWLSTNVRRVIGAELRVASATHRYAGTIDLAVELLDGATVVVDLKTGTTVGDDVPLQLIAYQKALLEQEGIRAVRRIVVHLPRNEPGKLTVVEYPSEDELLDWRAFLACSILWHRLFKTKGTAYRSIAGTRVVK